LVEEEDFMGLVDGKVAVVSGAARGQGRSHAVRLAEEGADIIALDICADVRTASYPMATRADLDETVEQIERLDRRVVASVTDVRDFEAVREAVDAGVAELGRLDIVVANAGINSPAPADELTVESWTTMIDVNLTGVWTLCRSAMPHMIESGRGGSMVLISSSTAHIGFANQSHYAAAKAGLIGLMQSLAVELGSHMIRVNTVHPTGVATPQVLNQALYDLFFPGAGLSPHTDDDGQMAQAMNDINAMPVGLLDVSDISNAVLYLVSDMGRYVTGTQLRVDAGSAVK
jgi:SDR family mycofactocin-dependent oxidoreductase